MTYSELKDNIKSFLNRSDLTDAQLDIFIDQTEAELNRKLRTKEMIKRANATADSQYLSLPTDWLEVINVEITSDFRPLFQQSLESLDVYRRSNDNVVGQPVYFAVMDDALELAPTPDTSYTLQLTYYEKIPALSSSNTSNFLSTNNPDIYLYGALKHASVFLMEDDRVALFTQQFDKALEQLRLAQEKAEFGKGSLVNRRRTYGRAKKNIYYYNNN